MRSDGYAFAFVRQPTARSSPRCHLGHVIKPCDSIKAKWIFPPDHDPFDRKSTDDSRLSLVHFITQLNFHFFSRKDRISYTLSPLARVQFKRDRKKISQVFRSHSGCSSDLSLSPRGVAIRKSIRCNCANEAAMAGSWLPRLPRLIKRL